MMDPVTARALAEIASRANELLSSHASGFEPTHSDVRGGAADPMNVAAAERRLHVSPDPLSSVAPPEAYFVVEDRAGRRRFSRNGGFAFDEGVLRSIPGGDPVLGFPAGVDLAHAVPVPLRADPADVAFGRCSAPRIEADGTLACTRKVIDPRSGEMRVERVALGRVALARFPAGTLPIAVDAQSVRAPLGVEPQIGVPADGRFAALATYSRDGGALDLDRALARMQEAYLTLDALHAAGLSRDGLDKTALDLVK